MCVTILADAPLHVKLLLESFYPVPDSTSRVQDPIRFEQTYDILLENTSSKPVKKIVFAHPRNVLAAVNPPDLQLRQPPYWLGERMFRSKPKIDRDTGNIEFSLYFPPNSLKPFQAQLVHKAKDDDQKYAVQASCVCAWDKIAKVYANHKEEFTHRFKKYNGITTFFSVELDRALPPASLDQLDNPLNFFSVSFPSQEVTPVAAYNAHLGKENTVAVQSFTLVSPMLVRQKLSDVIDEEIKEAATVGMRPHPIVSALYEKVELPIREMHIASIDEIRIAVVTDERCPMLAWDERGQISFFEIRELDQALYKLERPMVAHIWRASGGAHQADFQVFFSVAM